MWRFELIQHTEILPHLRERKVAPHKFSWLFTVQTWLQDLRQQTNVNSAR